MNHHHPHVAVYDIDKCVEVLVSRDGMTHEDADEFLSFNTRRGVCRTKTARCS